MGESERIDQELEARIKAIEGRLHALSNSLQVELLSVRKELGERIENFAKDWFRVGVSLQDESANLRREMQELVMGIDARSDRLSQIVHERTDSLVVYGGKYGG